jgi:hypothetical protein
VYSNAFFLLYKADTRIFGSSAHPAKKLATDVQEAAQWQGRCLPAASSLKRYFVQETINRYVTVSSG